MRCGTRERLPAKTTGSVSTEMPDTGMPRTDARTDFARERRRRALARIVSRLRAEPDDIGVILPFEEVVGALGRRGQRDLGIETIRLDSIVGTVDRGQGEFDRAFRPSPGVRSRWEAIAEARRRGTPMPPIDVYRVGDMHFVQDGHHRVSVARAQGDTAIEAHVTEVLTELGPGEDLRPRSLPLKRHERVFHERVPLPDEARRRIQLSDEWRYAQLANLVEAWGYRISSARGGLLSRRELAQTWFREEYEPVVQVLEEEGIGGAGTETERYLRIAMLRYLLLGTHEWTDEVVGRLLGDVRGGVDPARSEDTMVHQILKELR
jgi:hypothetical protein